MLNIVRHGNPTDRPPLLIAHGLFGSARNWNAIARRLATGREVLVPDMRNHGDSPWLASHGYPDLAADLAEVIEPDRPADVVGHSMGGKAAMMLALTRPELVRRLIVADIAPVAYTHSQSDLIAAMKGLDLATSPTTRTAMDERLAHDIAEPGVRAFLLQSLDLKADPPRWRLNLDVLDAEMPRIIGWPQPNGAVHDGPVIFLSGGESDYLRHEHRPAIRELFPQARFATLRGAGHWLHADQPRAFEETVRSILD